MPPASRTYLCVCCVVCVFACSAAVVGLVRWCLAAVLALALFAVAASALDSCETLPAGMVVNTGVNINAPGGVTTSVSDGNEVKVTWNMPSGGRPPNQVRVACHSYTLQRGAASRRHSCRSCSFPSLSRVSPTCGSRRWLLATQRAVSSSSCTVDMRSPHNSHASLCTRVVVERVLCVRCVQFIVTLAPVCATNVLISKDVRSATFSNVDPNIKYNVTVTSVIQAGSMIERGNTSASMWVQHVEKPVGTVPRVLCSACVVLPRCPVLLSRCCRVPSCCRVLVSSCPPTLSCPILLSCPVALSRCRAVALLSCVLLSSVLGCIAVLLVVTASVRGAASRRGCDAASTVVTCHHAVVVVVVGVSGVAR
jgi:hypothetical protein